MFSIYCLGPQLPIETSTDSCIPSPCGAFAICRNIGGMPDCSCFKDYTGSPPNCRPECSINSECISSLACIKDKCKDPCPGSCGITARCTVINHVPVCTCPEDYTGDPFTNCFPQQPQCKFSFIIFSIKKFIQLCCFQPM
jgi:hypothetical protein